MTSPLRAVPVAGLLLLSVVSCTTSSPAADLQTRMNAVVDAANAKDAAALRTAVGRFEELLAAESQRGDITATRSQALRTLAERVLVDASLLDAPVPTPSALPSAASTPAPTATPTSTRSTAPAPPPPPPSTPPTATPSPTPTDAPTPPVGVPSVSSSPSTGALGLGAAR